MERHSHKMSARTESPAWELEFGAQVQANRATRFRVWAPKATSLEVIVCDDKRRAIPLAESADHIFEATVQDVLPGSDYLYRIDGKTERPDPVSRCQAQGVHGPSRVVSPTDFSWTDQSWCGIGLAEYIVYEIHIGAFTQQGTFEAAITKLDHLKRLGVTAVEIMPVSSFPGERNWGYDGVHLYAPQESYGGPQGLKKLVDACHARGLAVILDVVYNHLGPEGNYLPEYMPIFTTRYGTPWGTAINFDDAGCDGVRRYFVDNALYWLTEYHVDALRLDAIHSIFDFGAYHILQELADKFRDQAKRLGRSAHLIAESDLNDARIINAPERGGYGIDAQWSDDFHHSLYAMLTGTKRGYFSDFESVTDLAKAVQTGFVYDWKRSRYRGRHHGNTSQNVPGEKLVISIENHDQIPNAAGGDRLGSLIGIEAQKTAAAILLASPNLPMLFMGQEYGEKAPFHYFTSHSDSGLVEAVRKGRRDEFLAFATHRDFADPHDTETFTSSKLRWETIEQSPFRQVLRAYQDLISLRKANPALANCRKDLTRAFCKDGERWIVIERADDAGARVVVASNLSDKSQSIPAPGGEWALKLWTGAAQYGGDTKLEKPASRVGRAASNITLAPWTSAIYELDKTAEKTDSV